MAVQGHRNTSALNARERTRYIRRLGSCMKQKKQSEEEKQREDEFYGGEIDVICPLCKKFTWHGKPNDWLEAKKSGLILQCESCGYAQLGNEVDIKISMFEYIQKNIRITEREKEIEEREMAERGAYLKLPFKLNEIHENSVAFHAMKPFFYDKVGIFWAWDKIKSRYDIVDEVDLMNIFERTFAIFGLTLQSSIKSQYLEAFKRIGRNHIPKDAPSRWIQFKGNAYSLRTGNIYKVEPNYFFTNPIPWEIGESEDTPVMDKLFTEWVGEDNKQLLYEILAYCCYSDYPIHRVFGCVGCGSNGKSRYLALLERFLGKENLCSTELDVLLTTRFEAFKLYKKMACIMGETNFGVLKNTSLLKKLTGQDLIGYEKKGKDPFDAANYAKIIISSNSLPISDDTSDGFYRRWIIINFPNQFPEGKDILETIPIIEYNNLAKKCCRILKGLLDTCTFTSQGSIEDRKIRYLQESNPLPLFLSEHTKRGPSCFCLYSELYTLFVQYLKNKKKRRIKSGDFKKALEDENLYVEKTSKKIGENEFKVGFWVEGIEITLNYSNYSNYALISTSPIYKDKTEWDLLHKWNKENKIEESADPALDLIDLAYKSVSNRLGEIVSIEDVRSDANCQDFDKLFDSKKHAGQYFEPKPGFMAKLR